MGLQRRNDIYGHDAHLFRPERWEEKTPDRWNFLPFNHGARICLGRQFGQQQMEYVVARICQQFPEITFGDRQVKQEIKVELNTKMAHPFMCHFRQKETSGSVP